MSRHWKEALDPERHRDWMRTSHVGGLLRDPPRDNLLEAWSYFVEVSGFTFEFASVSQIRECLRHCEQGPAGSTRESGVDLEHYWQRWFERLPKGLLAGASRKRVVNALHRALQEFDDTA